MLVTLRSKILFVFAVLLIIIGSENVWAQAESSLHVLRVAPYNQAVPGQILDLQVEGLGAADYLMMLAPKDFKIEVNQDGVTQQLNPRVVSPIMTRQTNPDGSVGEFKRLQNISFVVPHGLHPGEADVVLSYQGRQSNPIKLAIIERPMPPILGSVSIITVNPMSLPPPPRPFTRVDDLGWRLERDSKAELHVSPLPDPDDPASAVLIRFKQGGTFTSAIAQVVHRAEKAERVSGANRFSPARDSLEVEVPSALTMGPADMEISLRANGQTSDPITVKVQIVDSTRSAEAPAENAPRLMAVTPEKIGAGQTLMLSIDYLRTLNPDPLQTLVMIERGTARYVLKPDYNSAAHAPNWTPDVPVMLMARATQQIIGTAQVRVFNSLRGEQGGLSAARTIEIVDEVVPPEVTSAAEATDADLASLRQMYDIQHKAGRPFAEYDPSRVYFAIRGGGFDPNPNLMRVALEQNGRRATLAFADFSLYAGNLLILRVPEGITAGPVTMTIENRGGESFSTPVIRKFNLSKPR